MGGVASAVVALPAIPTSVHRPGTYGIPPLVLGHYELDWHEYMHYLYLPVKMAGSLDVRLPQQLDFLLPLVAEICAREGAVTRDSYVYVTARRGYATPGNPINRPGWHCDGFGTADVNYIWTDRWPTRFAIQGFGEVSCDHMRSIEQFEARVDAQSIVAYDECQLLRLDPFVVHAAPEIPEPGGDRSFLKISVSPDRYNLEGNSHNFLFDYDWHMWTRAEVRNHPQYAGGDAGPQ